MLLKMPASRNISITGAREHNLRDVDLVIPRDQLVVVTGVSGSGKSSLAFDTIFAEGQRKYMESLSAYARQFLQQMQKPDVERIDGAYKLTANDDGTTSVAYALEVDPGFAVPGFLRKTVTKIVVGAALPSLKKYLERK